MILLSQQKITLIVRELANTEMTGFYQKSLFLAIIAFCFLPSLLDSMEFPPYSKGKTGLHTNFGGQVCMKAVSGRGVKSPSTKGDSMLQTSQPASPAPICSHPPFIPRRIQLTQRKIMIETSFSQKEKLK